MESPPDLPPTLWVRLAGPKKAAPPLPEILPPAAPASRRPRPRRLLDDALLAVIVSAVGVGVGITLLFLVLLWRQLAGG